MAQLKVSPTSLSTYDRCPMEEYFSHIMSPDTRPDVPVWIKKVFGIAVHDFIARWMYRPSTVGTMYFKSRESAMKFWHLYWADALNQIGTLYPRPTDIWHLPNDNPQFYYGLGAKMVGDYYEDNQHNPRPTHLEYRIEHPLDSRTTLVAVIDQIWNDRVILDMKTGYGDQYEDADERKLFLLETGAQLSFQSLLYELTFGRPPAAIGIYHLGARGVYVTGRGEKHYNYIKRRARDLVESIQSENFSRRYGSHCRLCDYQVPCWKPEEYFRDRGTPLSDRDMEVIFSNHVPPPLETLPIQPRIELKVPKTTPRQRKKRLRSEERQGYRQLRMRLRIPKNG